MKHLLSIVAAVAVLATPVFADRKPRPSTAPDPQMIAKAFTNVTWDWSHGAAYFGRGGKFMSHWKESISDGKWYVTNKGSVCAEVTWRTKDDTGQNKTCWRHVVDKDGQLWQRHGDVDKEEWHKFYPEKRHVKGNKLKRDYNRKKRKAGL